MNGPEHYAEAERLIHMVAHDVPGNPQFTYFDGTAEDTAVTLAAAQVHATLALAATTVAVTR